MTELYWHKIFEFFSQLALMLSLITLCFSFPVLIYGAVIGDWNVMTRTGATLVVSTISTLFFFLLASAVEKAIKDEMKKVAK
jgi:hypothetical protein